MRKVCFKILALIFVFSIGFSCRNCGGSSIQDYKAGKLSIYAYCVFNNGVFMPLSDTINRTKDTLMIILKQDFYSASNYSRSSSDLMACQEIDIIPNYLDQPDSISVTTLSNFDSQTNANTNINSFCKLFRYNNSLEALSDYSFRKSYYNSDNINICLIKNPTTDSIQLNIKLYFNTGLVRSTDTKWLKFN